MFALFLGVMMLVYTGLDAASPVEDNRPPTALKEVTIDPEKVSPRLEKLERMVAKKANGKRKRRKDKAKQYAFSAYLSDKNAFVASGGLKFTKPITNVGGAYNEHTGVFTAAADGVYFFYFHGDTFKGAEHCVITLFHGKNNVASSFSYDANGNPSLGNAAVIELKTADVVHVAVTSPFVQSACYLRGRFTTFSGFKLP